MYNASLRMQNVAVLRASTTPLYQIFGSATRQCFQGGHHGLWNIRKKSGTEWSTQWIFTTSKRTKRCLCRDSVPYSGIHTHSQTLKTQKTQHRNFERLPLLFGWKVEENWREGLTQLQSGGINAESYTLVSPSPFPVKAKMTICAPPMLYVQYYYYRLSTFLFLEFGRRSVKPPSNLRIIYIHCMDKQAFLSGQAAKRRFDPRPDLHHRTFGSLIGLISLVGSFALYSPRSGPAFFVPVM